MTAQSIYKIKIKTPTAKNGSWFISYPTNNKMTTIKREDGKVVYHLVKRKILKFLASAKGGKTGVSVFYPHKYRNETKIDSNYQATIYALACFLEDYLSPSILRKAEREFLGSITNKNYSH